MRLLITGGFGYLGGRLAQFFSRQEGCEILLGSRHQSSPPIWQAQVKVVQTRWDEQTSLERACLNVDVVIHLAGMNAQSCAENPALALEFNGVATTRLLQAATECGVKRFIYFSTAHVYDSPLSGKITEETCPASLHPYATSHLVGENVVRSAHQRREVEGVVVRLSNAYGAPVHKDVNCWRLLVNDLCKQAVMSQSMVLRSTGLQRRDFVTVTDVCRAADHILHLSRESLLEGLFNVGGEWSPTIWEMACLVRERCLDVLGFNPEIVRPRVSPGEQTNELDYRIDALRKSGFQLTSTRSVEIDRLLDFCRVFK